MEIIVQDTDIQKYNDKSQKNKIELLKGNRKERSV